MMGSVSAWQRLLKGMGVAAIPVLTALLALGGSTQSAQASHVCEIGALGQLDNGDRFEGYALSESDSIVRARWVHVAHTEGAVLVVPTHSFTSQLCSIDGSSIGVLTGTGLWNGRAVDVELGLRDDLPDDYILRVYEDGALIYQIEDALVVEGDIEVSELPH